MAQLRETSDAPFILVDDKGNELAFKTKESLVEYVNTHGLFLGFEEDHTDRTDTIGYWRMYFHNEWHGRWIGEVDLSQEEIDGVNNIVEYFVENYPFGCSWSMISHFKKSFDEVADGRYQLMPVMSNRYVVVIDTRYGNAEYPVKIFVRRSRG